MNRSIFGAVGPRPPLEPRFEVIQATHLIRRLPGKSGSVLALGSDDQYYIIKFTGNPKGRNSLANEVLGSQLARRLALPTPNFKFARVSKKSLYEAPVDWFCDYRDGRPSHLDYHLAIPFLGNPGGLNTSETVPSWNYAIRHRKNHFLGMLLLDILANTQAARQVLFAPEDGCTTPYFIDFGSMFGGADGVFDDKKFTGFYFDYNFYSPELHLHPLRYWIDIMTSDLPEVLDYGYRNIPGEWYGPSYSEVRPILHRRLPDLLYLAQTLIRRHERGLCRPQYKASTRSSDVPERTWKRRPILSRS